MLEPIQVASIVGALVGLYFISMPARDRWDIQLDIDRVAAPATGAVSSVSSTGRSIVSTKRSAVRRPPDIWLWVIAGLVVGVGLTYAGLGPVGLAEQLPSPLDVPVEALAEAIQ